ncbi:MAG: 16S rRNA (cytosine(1402)-N(4))-methyltransferase RsmH [Eubacterium sp.]|nr:16S rRNA (cytosine(1402)-N(4))-methyltransferase RsmH [Eubacterium sp.]
MEFKHKSVLLDEVIENLHIKPDGIYVDGTIGGGGHSLEVCRRLSDKGRLIGIDQDEDAIAAAQERLKEFKDRVTILRGNYRDMVAMLANEGITHVDGILLDLGVSSFQLDNAGRGFTYREDARLDMRMDRRKALSAYEVVNEYDEQSLYKVIRDYGEEKFAKNIAKHICQERQKKPVETTGELVEIIKASIPAKMRATGGHPAKRTFQAIRVEVNRELEVLEESLDGMINILNDGGRICVITFQSMEDRIVKNNFKRNENPCICPPEFPVCVCGRVSRGKVVTRKPIVPTEKEQEENPRSKSSKLRVFERIIKGSGSKWPDDTAQPMKRLEEG